MNSWYFDLSAYNEAETEAQRENARAYADVMSIIEFPVDDDMPLGYILKDGVWYKVSQDTAGKFAIEAGPFTSERLDLALLRL